MPELICGDYMSRDEFLRRWEAMPQVKRAELIRGVVYMPSPVSWQHGDTEQNVAGWLAVYKASTAGCAGANNATWLMGEEDAPQPDTSLRILPEYGGQSRMEGQYAAGAPEFLAEVCISSTAYDLHQKLEVYQEAGVREYLEDGRSGLLVPPGDAAALADGLRRLLTEGELRRRLVEHGRQRVAALDLPRAVRAYERLLTDVVKA